MADRPGRVPEHLRDALRGLRATATNDVAAGAVEDDDPLSHVGDLIEEGSGDGLMAGREQP